MKRLTTAQEIYWMIENGDVKEANDRIAHERLDAMKEGARRAAEIVAENWNGHESNYCALIRDQSQKWTEKDLA